MDIDDEFSVDNHRKTIAYVHPLIFTTLFSHECQGKTRDGLGRKLRGLSNHSVEYTVGLLLAEMLDKLTGGH